MERAGRGIVPGASVQLPGRAWAARWAILPSSPCQTSSLGEFKILSLENVHTIVRFIHFSGCDTKCRCQTAKHFVPLRVLPSAAADCVYCFRRVLLMPVKTASWRRQSEPPYRRPTMSPQMSLTPLTPPDQRTNPMQSRFLTARDPSLSMAQTVKHRHRTKRKVQPANRRRRPQPSSAYIQTVPLLPTESLHTKKTITVTRKRRAKKTTWSPRLLVLFIPNRMQTLGGTTAPHKPKVLETQASAPQRVTWTVLMTTVRQIQTCLLLAE